MHVETMKISELDEKEKAADSAALLKEFKKVRIPDDQVDTVKALNHSERKEWLETQTRKDRRAAKSKEKRKQRRKLRR